MEHTKPSTLELTVTREGSLEISEPSLKALGLKPGAKVEVRITELGLSRSLQDRGVTEDEIDRIRTMQWEGRENVVRFLIAEGALSHKRTFRDRVNQWLKR